MAKVYSKVDDEIVMETDDTPNVQEFTIRELRQLKNILQNDIDQKRAEFDAFKLKTQAEIDRISAIIQSAKSVGVDPS